MDRSSPSIRIHSANIPPSTSTHERLLTLEMQLQATTDALDQKRKAYLTLQESALASEIEFQKKINTLENEKEVIETSSKQTIQFLEERIRVTQDQQQQQADVAQQTIDDLAHQLRELQAQQQLQKAEFIQKEKKLIQQLIEVNENSQILQQSLEALEHQKETSDRLHVTQQQEHERMHHDIQHIMDQKTSIESRYHELQQQFVQTQLQMKDYEQDNELLKQTIKQLKVQLDDERHDRYEWANKRLELLSTFQTNGDMVKSPNKSTSSVNRRSKETKEAREKARCHSPETSTNTTVEKPNHILLSSIENMLFD